MESSIKKLSEVMKYLMGFLKLSGVAKSQWGCLISHSGSLSMGYYREVLTNHGIIITYLMERKEGRSIIVMIHRMFLINLQMYLMTEFLISMDISFRSRAECLKVIDFYLVERSALFI